MKKSKVAVLAVSSALAALTVFHILHYVLFCRYRGVPDKSHCAICGHCFVCRKLHKRKMTRAAAKTKVPAQET